MSVDHVTFSIITNAFLAIAQEMSADLLRTAYSTVIREAADASTCLIDRHGRILAQAQNIPLHLNSVSPAIQGCLKVISKDSLTEDDVIILNDPYSGGQHQSDIYMFSPIIYDGQPAAFSGSVGHYVDLGHSPGFNLYARDTFMERIRFTPMKFSLSRDWNGGLLEQLMRANVRMPREVIGDMNAQLTANETGRRRMKELFSKYGTAVVMEAGERFIEYAAERMNEAIRSIPPGTYVGEEQVDDDGISDDPIRVSVVMKADGSKLSLDFTGTGPQAKTAINCPWASTTSSALSVLKMILTDPSLPVNDGIYHSVSITAPIGTIVNPGPHAPVEGRNVVVMRIFQAVMKALAQAVPDKVAATGYDTRTELSFHWAGDNQYVAVSDLYGGGYGAGPANDGADQLDDPLGNCKNTPVESLEATQPLFLVTRYELRQDSGGPGEFRGGLGAVRCYEMLQDEVHMSVYSDRFKYPADGLFGGHQGTCSYIRLVRADGSEEMLRSKGETLLHKGDYLEVGIGGGGGYGLPAKRDRSRVAQDVADGRVSPDAARQMYGWDG